MCYHNNVIHKISYTSLDCGVKLIRHMLNSDFTKRLHLGRTKSEALVNVLAPKAKDLLLHQLTNKNSCIQTDASNVKNRKFFPIAVELLENDQNFNSSATSDKWITILQKNR